MSIPADQRLLEQLSHSEIYEDYDRAFSEATGLPLLPAHRLEHLVEIDATPNAPCRERGAAFHLRHRSRVHITRGTVRRLPPHEVMHFGKSSPLIDATTQTRRENGAMRTYPRRHRLASLAGAYWHRPMRLLVVEDELKMAAYLRRALHEEGHTVEEAHDGETALGRALAEPFDALVLDLNLPKRDGLSVLRQMRAAACATPVLILSARGQTEDRIAGLQLGADDYLPKPFAMEELLARVNALLRQAESRREGRLTVADLVVETTTHAVTRAGRRIELPMREYGLLEYLVRCAGRTVSRAQILEHVWGYHFDPGTNVVDVYIQRLRRKVDDGHAQKLIHTAPGLGYRLAAEP